MLLFAYGSNLALDGGFVGPAVLPDHRLELNRRSIRWGGGVVDVVPALGERVWGALYEVDEPLMAALDRKEGAGLAYRRVRVEVERGGERLAAQTYEVIDKERDAPPATPDYAALVLAGARERGLPAEWLAVLDSVLRGWDRCAAGRAGRFRNG
ncbi:MAG: gamma-glutamylcyclotransferase [Thermoleophilaceae bacterium]|nr:gamma-glutamylcyclotransferase [Thermoleophilaceae bacterium]